MAKKTKNKPAITNRDDKIAAVKRFFRSNLKNLLDSQPKRHIVFILIITALTLLVYSNTFHSPFIFDDSSSISKNMSVRNFSFRIFKSALRPVTYMTFAFNYKLNGLDTFGYHVFNNVLHILNGIIIYFFIFITLIRWKTPEKLTLKPDIIAFAGALIFAVHPIQTESVTYISSRSEELAAFFTILGMLFFTLWVKTHNEKLLYVLMPVTFYLGFFSKQTAVVLPVLMIIYDFFFVAELSIRNVLKRWLIYMFIGIVGVYGLYRNFFTSAGLDLGADKSSSAAAAVPRSVGFHQVGDLLGSYEYFCTQLRVIVKYIQLMFFPVGQNLDYDFPPSKSLFEPTVIISGLILLAVIALAIWLIPRMRLISFGILWFFIALAPTSSFVPILDVIFEHRLYLPSVGFILAFVLAVDQFPLQKKPEISSA